MRWAETEERESKEDRETGPARNRRCLRLWHVAAAERRRESTEEDDDDVEEREREERKGYWLMIEATAELRLL